MNRAREKPCLLIRRPNDKVAGVIALQVDDTLMLATADFLEEEDHAIKRFKTKERVIICDEPTLFNGINTSKGKNNMVAITQEDKIEKEEIRSCRKQFASKRAMCQYIGVNRIPETCVSVRLIAPRK